MLARRQAGLARRETHATERQAAAAEAEIELIQKQLEVAQLQADRERAAYLAPAPAGDSWSEAWVDQGVRLHNGGAYPATEIKAWFASQDGAIKSRPTIWPMIAPGQTEELRLNLARSEVYRGAAPLYLHLRWLDGRGVHEEQTSMQARQEGTPSP